MLPVMSDSLLVDTEPYAIESVSIAAVGRIIR